MRIGCPPTKVVMHTVTCFRGPDAPPRFFPFSFFPFSLFFSVVISPLPSSTSHPDSLSGLKRIQRKPPFSFPAFSLFDLNSLRSFRSPFHLRLISSFPWIPVVVELFNRSIYQVQYTVSRYSIFADSESAYCWPWKQCHSIPTHPTSVKCATKSNGARHTTWSVASLPNGLVMLYLMTGIKLCSPENELLSLNTAAEASCERWYVSLPVVPHHSLSDQCDIVPFEDYRQLQRLSRTWLDRRK